MFRSETETARLVSDKARSYGARLVALIGLLLLTSSTPGRAQEKAASPPQETKPSEYAGSTVCQTCHEDIFNAFQKSPHQVVETDKKRGWSERACESCHGIGGKHAESV